MGEMGARVKKDSRKEREEAKEAKGAEGDSAVDPRARVVVGGA